MLWTRSLAIAALLALCCIGSTHSHGEISRPGADLATPPLRLEDLGGRVHALPDYRGRVVVVNFWASWCAPCLVEMPGLQRLARRFDPRVFSVLAVNAGETPAEVWKMRRRLAWQLPLLLDRGGEAVADWGVKIYPTSFVIDATGRVRHQITGMREWDSAATIGMIETLLAEQSNSVEK